MLQAARPYLYAAAERTLILRAQDGDAHARDELVEAFMPLVASVARLYRGAPAVGRHELMQDGVVGLLRALERFDPATDTPFWAYASWWVRQAMQQLVSELARPVVLSDRAIRQLSRIKQARRRLEQEEGHEPTPRTLGDACGLGEAQVEHLMVAARVPRGLEERLRGSDEETSGTYGELLRDPHAEDEYERVPSRLVIEALPALLEALDERERTIVDARFGLVGPELTLRQLSQALGVSAERVRQLEQRALQKLRDALDSPLQVPVAAYPRMRDPTGGRDP
jgi:RNA polymerase primary sigma factor